MKLEILITCSEYERFIKSLSERNGKVVNKDLMFYVDTVEVLHRNSLSQDVVIFVTYEVIKYSKTESVMETLISLYK